MKRTLLARLRKSWWFAWVVAGVLAMSHLGNAADGINKILVLVKLRPDGLALAQNAEKGAFSRELTELAWRRMFWARSYCSRTTRKAPPNEIDEAWRAYISASEAWSSRTMVFIISTEEFYGSSKANELESTIQTALNKMAKALVAVHYDSAPVPEAEQAIDDANLALYHFVRGFNPENRG